MCGIGGVAGTASVNLQAMQTALAHRGPDDRGIWTDPQGRLSLVHTRLSIIDLSSAGRQPMSNEDESVWMIFNGEIYNFQELRETLSRRGHRFRSATDSEVIIHLYEDEGLEGLRHLNGMFAFALWDERAARLVLARDQVGIKPLYYMERDGTLLFGSEIKALLALGVPRELNEQAIADYFTFLHVPAPETAFEGIQALPAGHWLVWDHQTRHARLQSYWHPMTFPAETDVPVKEWGPQLRARLEDAVRRQLISDVPLGILLSGGVDSTILTGLAASVLPQVQTFTVSFRDVDATFYDERKRARAVSQRFGTRHAELEVAIEDLSLMYEMVDHFDQPFGNPTALLNFLISRYARRSVTVALCGSGGDELFAGYPRYRAAQLARLARRMPATALRVAARATRLVAGAGPLARRAQVFVDGLPGGPLEQYLRWTYYFGPQRKTALLHPRILAGSLDASRFLTPYFMDGLDPVDAMQRADLGTYLPDNILEYSDKTSMAVALELRVPYLDRQVVEWVLRMPSSLKLKAAQSKWILRQVCGDLLPRESLAGGKQGFCPPLELWMDRFFDGYFDRHLSRLRVEKEAIFQWDALQRLRGEHQQGVRNHAMELFGIIMFDVWYRKYISNQW